MVVIGAPDADASTIGAMAKDPKTVSADVVNIVVSRLVATAAFLISTVIYERTNQGECHLSRIQKINISHLTICHSMTVLQLLIGGVLVGAH